jgi:hypothetical protein
MPRWCGNDPNAPISSGDRAVIIAFDAHLRWALVRDQHGEAAAGREPAWPPDGPCLTTWTPRTCRSLATGPAARIRSPIDHMCTMLRAFPHVCRCSRCDQPAGER